MECLEYYFLDLVFGFIWVLICVAWAVVFCFLCNRYSVFFHLVLNGMIALKIFPALNVLFCLAQVSIDWLDMPLYIIIGIFQMLDFFSILGVIYFISIGFGFCDVLISGVRFKSMLFLFSFCYVCGGLVYFYPAIGYLLVPFYFQLLYVISLNNIQNTIVFIRDLGYEFAENQIEIIKDSKTCIFIYCHVFSIYYTVMSLNFYWLGLQLNLVYFYKGLEVILLLRILFIYRPRYASFAEDFLFPQETELLNILEAKIYLNYTDFKHPHCVVMIPDQGQSLMYGQLI